MSQRTPEQVAAADRDVQTLLLLGIFSWLTPYAWFIDGLIFVGILYVVEQMNDAWWARYRGKS